jgi:magnesium transporter
VQEALLRLIRNHAFTSAYNALKKTHPADLAALWTYLQTSELQWFAESILSSGKLGDVISELDEAALQQFVQIISEEHLVKALQTIDPDDAADLIAMLPEEKRGNIIEKLDAEQKHAVGTLLGYEPETAGGIMTTEYVALSANTTLTEAVEKLRDHEVAKEIFDIYVIDDSDQLVGVVNFRDIVLNRGDKILADIMDKEPIVVRAHANQELVADMIARYDLLSIPVVDESHRLIGRVTVDDAIDVMREEATEDIYHLASLSKEDHIYTPVFASLRRRSPWLLVNLATALLAALVVASFEETIAQFVILAAMIPVVANMGGNAGNQALTVVVRALALGEVDWSVAMKVIWKEMRVGLLNGLIVGTLMGGLTYWWYDNTGLSLIMFVSMTLNLTIGGLFGAFIPLLLRRFRQDPAVGSSIFVTTATDIGGFFIFLSLASALISLIIM